MASEITQRQRAEAIIDKVKAELTPIWLGGRQRMLLVDEIEQAITTARHEALREASDLIKLMPMLTAHNVAAVLDRLAREGVK